MPATSSLPEANSISSYIEEGARIAAILLIWSIIAAFFRYGVTDAGLPFEALWYQLGRLFALTGLLNALLYLLFRTVDYWHEPT